MWDHGILIESARIPIAQGIIAGLCGGVAMAALGSATHHSPWHMPERLASVVLGSGLKDGVRSRFGCSTTGVRRSRRADVVTFAAAAMGSG